MPGPKVVGPNVMGNREEYQLVRRLQSALFGGVYEAKGLSSNRDFAIKVLHKSELTKVQESSSIEFCEVPLMEIRFADLMRGHEHVMEAEEHFEDQYCFYVVFELARGGDLLEALKQKPHGFDEAHAQFLIKQAAKGLAFLHERHVAMQDVSLENMLLHVQESTGHYQVKVCDPGQAVIFEIDQDGEEAPVEFRGLVGKSFRPPELHEQQPYCATKVDSWCLGWSTFYLLTAQPLFMSADPALQDADWLLFQQGDFATLFQQKSNLCSRTGLDFIFRLLQLEPRGRMSVADSLNHSWLADPSIQPVLAPKELLPNHLESERRHLEIENGHDHDTAQLASAGAQSVQPEGLATAGTTYAPLSPNLAALPGRTSWSGNTTLSSSLGGTAIGGNELPTWATVDRDSRRHPNHSRLANVATVHSPAPKPLPYAPRGVGSAHQRVPSPLQRRRPVMAVRAAAEVQEGRGRSGRARPSSPFPSGTPTRHSATIPSSTGSSSWPMPIVPAAPSRQSPIQSRTAQSPPRSPGATIAFQRPLSPRGGVSASLGTSTGVGVGEVRSSSLGGSGGSALPRTFSPTGVAPRTIESSAIGFNWPAPPLSPRAGSRPTAAISGGGGAVSRIASPAAAAAQTRGEHSILGTAAGVSRIASPLTQQSQQSTQQAQQQQTQSPQQRQMFSSTLGTTTNGAGFAWVPEPLSPRVTARSFSPSPSASRSIKAIPPASSVLPRWPP